MGITPDTAEIRDPRDQVPADRPRHRGPRRWLTIVAIIVVVAAVAASAIAILSRGNDGTVSAAEPSAGSSPSPRPETVVPPPPAELKAKGTPNRVVLSWSAPATSEPIEGYDVLRDGALVGSVNAPKRKFVDEEVVPGTRYRYEVVALGSDDVRSESADVRVKTPVPPLSEARVEGVFDVSSRFTSKTGYGEYTAPTFGWRLKPKCKSGPCGFVLRDIHRDELHPTFTRSGATYEATFSAKWELQCGGTRTTSTGTIVLRVIKAKVIDEEWRATRLTGTFTHQETAQLGCGSSKATLAVNAKLYD